MAAGVAVGLLVRHLGREPEFKGRPLGVWASDLRSADTAVRRQAEEAFRGTSEGVEFLAERISAGQGPIERASERAGRYLPEAFKRRLRRIYDPGRQIRDKHLAAQALLQLGTNAGPAIPALEMLLHDSNPLLSSSAGMTLGRIGPAALPVLLKALDAPDFTVRSSACAALGQLTTNAAPAVPRLAEVIEQESGPIVSYAASTLAQIRGPAVPGLITLLGSTNWSSRRWAAFALANIGYDAEEAIPALIRAADDSNIQVRWAVVEALTKVSRTSPEVASALVEALNDSEATIRGIAMAELATRPSVVRRNLEQIEPLLHDESPMVRSNAALALKWVKR